MKIPLQVWLETQPLSQQVRSSFDESFECLRAAASKAALLFAYLGFMSALKDRILVAPPPNGIAVQHWSQIQSRARSAETWERAVFDATQQQQPAAIFPVSDDLRRQIEYWKDRRNDCAHSRPNRITLAHVESFYAFIESNLNKFVVNGSSAAMGTEILEHFDPSQTPPDAPIQPLIDNIPHTIPADELDEFLSRVLELFEEERSEIDRIFNRPNRDVVQFLNGCYQYGTEELQEATTQTLFADEATLVAFLRAHPERTPILTDAPTTIRRLWHDHLFTGNEDDFPVLSSLVRHQLIPSGQVDEAFRHVIRRMIRVIPDEIDRATLENSGFFTQLEEAIVEEGLLGDFDWANAISGILILHLDRSPITESLAACIGNACHGQYYPFDLAPALDRFFSANPAKADEYLELARASESVRIPERLPSLREREAEIRDAS